MMFLGQIKHSVGLFCGLQGKNWGITTGPFYRHHYMTLLFFLISINAEQFLLKVEFITYALNAFLLNVKIFNFSCKLQAAKMFKVLHF